MACGHGHKGLLSTFLLLKATRDLVMRMGAHDLRGVQRSTFSERHAWKGCRKNQQWQVTGEDPMAHDDYWGQKGTVL